MKNKKDRPKPLSALATVLIALPLMCPVMPAEQVHSKEVSIAGFDVYNALLRGIHFPHEHPLILISNRTLSFKCGQDSGNPILLNGCSGLTFPPDTPEQVKELLAKNWPGMQKSTWANFRELNATTSELTDGFATPWQHRLVDFANLKGVKSYDCVFFLSRPGLSQDQTEALVFLFIASYANGVPTSGNYFLLHRDKSREWAVEYDLQYWTTDPKSDSQKQKLS